MQNYIELEKLYYKITNLKFINEVLDWDNQVIMPKNSHEVRNSQITVLENLIHDLETSNNLEKLIDKASEENLQGIQLANLNRIKNIFIHAKAVPALLVEKYSSKSLECENLWRRARKENDFKTFAPHLQELVQITKEIANYKAEKLKVSPYEALMDKYDPGRKISEIEEIFNQLEVFLPEFIKKVMSNQKPFLPLKEKMSIEHQEKLGKILSIAVGLDYNYARLDQSIHPFCSGNKYDVRITSRYDESNFLYGIMGILHETGHALYERNLPANTIYQPVGQTCSMTLHESQSLFVEMQLCYRKEFFVYLSKLLNNEFSLNSEIYSSENLYQIANHVTPSFIRVEADEVTYPLHIIIRYKIEKELIESNLQVSDIPEKWNCMMESYLGIRPKTYSEGCLQDIHWPSGNFGYFPCYSLGAILASQLYNKASQKITNLGENISQGNFKPIINWLEQNFHSLASTIKVNEIIKSATGENLNVDVYKNYLKEKYQILQ